MNVTNTNRKFSYTNDGQKAFFVTSLIILAFFVVTAVIGGVRGYSPVPFWDMWNGYLGFFENVQSGDYSAWWKPHNEHRIILSRLLFWLDLYFFDGLGVSLLIANYILVVCAWAVFMLFARAILPRSHMFVAVLVSSWLFFWCQENNLTWGFQSQFLLAQSIPLSALYFLYKSTEGKNSAAYFMAAISFGVLSLGTMANGVATLPIMTVYAVLAKIPFRRITQIVVVSVVFLAAHFMNYSTVGGSSLDAVRSMPVDFIKFYLIYIGSPFFYMVGGSFYVAAAAGLLSVFLSAILFLIFMRRFSSYLAHGALLAFVGYIHLTALATAAGRVSGGLAQAVSSRYTTPAIMAWIALIILATALLLQSPKLTRVRIFAALATVTAMFIPFQLSAAEGKDKLHFGQWVAALALQMGIPDQRQVEYVFPDAVAALKIARVPSEMGWSVFGRPELKPGAHLPADIAQKAGLPQTCTLKLQQVKAIENFEKYIAVEGFYSGVGNGGAIQNITLAEAGGSVVGHLLVYPKPEDGGYHVKGYVLSNAQATDVYAFDPSLECVVKLAIPAVAFKTVQKFDPADVSVISSQVLLNDGWRSGDFSGSPASPLIVYGTGDRSDQDVGRFSIRLRRGEKLLLRTGPSTKKQMISVENSAATVLPVSVDWTLLDFAGVMLPETFVVTFEDRGTEWGEWSSVAVRQK